MQKTCNYCTDIYEPRSQVKNPQACNKEQCQKLRQRDNEKKWHQKNKGLYDKKYHQIKKSVRDKAVIKIVSQLTNALLTGLRFEGKILCNSSILDQYFSSLGIRSLNKLWILQPPG